jgi:hypothetical protein
VAEKEWLLHAAEAIGGGDPIDWDALEAEADGPEERAVLGHLRTVDAIARVCRELQGEARRPAPVDAVVGWLVCIAGPDRGRDYRLRGGTSSVGRGEGMEVHIEADPAVSRDVHAIVTFEPRHARFTLAPGAGRGLVYRNGEDVDRPTVLHARDVIELGATKLLFVPLCGDDFRWEE